jgi:Outer membrane lipoprotein carrier protein LolA-like
MTTGATSRKTPAVNRRSGGALASRFAGLLLVATAVLAGQGTLAAAAPDPVAVSQVSDFGLSQLAQLLHREVAATADFHELQYRRVLKEPLERRGELHFEPPALFEKRVLVPVTETYRIEGETLSVELPKRATRQISLRNQPLLGGLLLGFKAVISGRLDTLAATFDSTVSGTADEWRLDLRPTQADVVRYIDIIHISGRGSEPLRFEVLERSGDLTVTDIEPR